MLDAFFASVFNSNDRLRGSQRPELEDPGCENDKYLEFSMWDLLLQLDPYKSMGPDGIQQRILNCLMSL